ncbi:hypothetical protein VNI00_007876 [Paramarasmius palmivorus]|uniref:F-box domain-containing protein n=1 Tax=Paramarasmius palmivorus TaxID=297713 RepID=A0AAW0CZ71_9AGAR
MSQVVVREDVQRASPFKPISRVPSELLCEIFTQFIPRRPEDNFRLTLTHVCRLWRTVAIGLQSLWTFPDFRTPELAREMLIRSGRAPLHIQFLHTHFRLAPGMDLEQYKLAQMDILSQALSDSFRLESVHLDVPSVWLRSVLTTLIQPAPLLHSLNLGSDRCVIPLNFLSDDAPRLTRLIIDGCEFPYNSPLLRNLTSLKLSGGYETTFEERLHEALRLMPALEYLGLAEVECDTPDEEVIATLPRLRQLDLEGTQLSCSSILNHISFPATASVQITIEGADLPEEDLEDLDTFWRDIARILSPEFYKGQQRVIKTLSADGNDDIDGSSLTLKAWHTTLPFDFSLDDHPRNSPNLSVTIDWSDCDYVYDSTDSPFFDNVFKAAFRALHLPALETMQIGSFPHDDHEFLTIVLVHAFMPRLWSVPLRTLVVNGCVDYLPRLLTWYERGRPLPALETLVLTSIDLNEELVEDLYDCLECRSEEGLQLQKLIVRESGSWSGMGKLREVVGEVDFDTASDISTDGESTDGSAVEDS